MPDVDIDWIDPVDGHDGGDDVIEVQQRWPRRLRWPSHSRISLTLLLGLVVAILAAAVVTSLLVLRPSSTVSADPLARPALSGPPTPTADPSYEVGVVTAMRAEAYVEDELTDRQLPDAAKLNCASGPDPAIVALRVLYGSLPAYSVRDFGRGLGSGGVVCSIDVRAVDPNGDIALIKVSVPALPNAVPFTFVLQNDSAGPETVAASANQSGWSIQICVTGPGRVGVSADELAVIAASPSLLRK